MGIHVEPSGYACGATVTGVDLGEELSAEQVAEIRSAWLEHRVLSFPDQGIDLDALQRFNLAFGPFGVDPFIQPLDEHPHVIAVHRAADETAPVFANAWHADWSFQAQPPDGTCLLSRIIPPVGGDTLFADQVKALESLPADLRARIQGLQAIHSAAVAYAPTGIYGEVEDGVERATRIVASDEATATRSHPLVRTHWETGEQSLYGCIGYISGIEGMTEEAAVALLFELYAHQGADEVVYRHRWEPDMLVMWDNRAVLHMATDGYDGHERLLHRTTIGYAGDR